MKPHYQISIDGQSLNLQGRLISLTLSDKNGFVADELTIEIDDTDGLVKLPKKGVSLTAEFGFLGEIQNKGEYIVDEVAHNGPPDTVTVVAHSANFRDSLLEQREKSYHNTTLGKVLEQIAKRNQLEPAISDKYKQIKIKHEDQNNESDGNLLTRLAKDYGAVGTIKSNHLLFIERGTGKTASGTELPTATITRKANNIDGHNYREMDRNERVTRVSAYYHSHKKGKRKKVDVGAKGYRRHLKKTFATKKAATHAAEAELKRLKTTAKTLSFNLVVGRADLVAEMPIKVIGFKPQIDEVKWFIKDITHNLNDSGYTCSVNCEMMSD